MRYSYEVQPMGRSAYILRRRDADLYERLRKLGEAAFTIAAVTATVASVIVSYNAFREIQNPNPHVASKIANRNGSRVSDTVGQIQAGIALTRNLRAQDCQHLRPGPITQECLDRLTAKLIIR